SLGVLKAGTPEAEAVAHALRLVASIPAGKQCSPNIRAILKHDGMRVSHSAESLLLGSLAATATHPTPPSHPEVRTPSASTPAPRPHAHSLPPTPTQHSGPSVTAPPATSSTSAPAPTPVAPSPV